MSPNSTQTRPLRAGAAVASPETVAAEPLAPPGSSAALGASSRSAPAARSLRAATWQVG